MTPLVLVAVAAAVIVAVKPGPARVDAVVGLACFLALLVLAVGVVESLGRRLTGPALPDHRVAASWPRRSRSRGHGFAWIAMLTAVWGALCQ